MPSEQVTIPVSGDAELTGDLGLPPSPHGVVLFVHGSGSTRRSPRNRAVAGTFQDDGWATLLVDLLTPEEQHTDEATGQHRFDIPLLTGRTTTAADWLQQYPATRDLPLHLFGASTGAAAALRTAAARPQATASVVSRGGRPDLAAGELNRVTAPVLLLVGERDPQVLELNREAAQLLPGEHRLEVVPGATHLFEEPGALEKVADAAEAWLRHTTSGHSRNPQDGSPP